MAEEAEPGPGLEVYIYGASKGETILLHLPDSRWALIDFYTPRQAEPERNPAWQLLRNRGVKELAFVCLTHPHDDHFRGMSRLFEEFKVGTFWSLCGYDPMDFKLLRTYFTAVAENVKRRLPKTRAKELGTIFDEVESNRCIHEYVLSRNWLYPLDEKSDFKVWGLAPCSPCVLRYKQALMGSLARKLSAGPLPHAAHNIASVALRIDFKGSRVILGGDVEKESWRKILERHHPDQLAADVVKVSHHGSTNGYCDRLWPVLSPAGGAIAVITPYRRFDLPDPVALEHIVAHAGGVYSTNLAAHRSKPRAEKQSSVERSFRVLKLLAASKLRSDRSKRVDRAEMGCCRITIDVEGRCKVSHESPAGRI